MSTDDFMCLDDVNKLLDLPPDAPVERTRERLLALRRRKIYRDRDQDPSVEEQAKLHAETRQAAMERVGRWFDDVATRSGIDEGMPVGKLTLELFYAGGYPDLHVTEEIGPEQF